MQIRRSYSDVIANILFIRMWTVPFDAMQIHL